MAMSRMRPFWRIDIRCEKSPLRAAISASSRSWSAASLGGAPFATAAAFFAGAPSRLAAARAGPLARATRVAEDAACEVAFRAPDFAGVRVCLRRVGALGNGPPRAVRDWPEGRSLRKVPQLRLACWDADCGRGGHPPAAGLTR